MQPNRRPDGRDPAFHRCAREGYREAGCGRPWAQQIPVQDLPEETLLFLLGSRYCDTDRMSEVAWNLFGASDSGRARVQTICDFVHNHIAFGYQRGRRRRRAKLSRREWASAGITLTLR